MNILKRWLLAAILSAAAAPAFALDVNQANQAQLESIKGIGPALSAKILAAREQGEFKDWSDLVVRVNGLGTNAAAKLSAAGLTVNGAPYAPPGTETPQ